MTGFVHGRPLLVLFGVAARGIVYWLHKERGFKLGLEAVQITGLDVGW